MTPRYLSVSEMNEWCTNMCRSFESFQKKHGKWIKCYTYEDIGVTLIQNIKTGKTATAKCHESDKFISFVGIAIAWARYTGIRVPKRVSCIHTLKDIPEGTYIILNNNAFRVCGKAVDFNGNETGFVNVVREDGVAMSVPKTRNVRIIQG